MILTTTRRFLLASTAFGGLALFASGAFAADTALTFLVDNNPPTVKMAQALIDAYTKTC